jgi:hypothetical protein
MTLNEAVQIIEKKTNNPLSLKLLVKLFEDGVITVNNQPKPKFKFGFC